MKSVLKLVLNVIRSILDVKNSLKQADVLTVSIKNTTLSNNNNNIAQGAGKKKVDLPVFYCIELQKLLRKVS
jgi:hypothetical protein